MRYHEYIQIFPKFSEMHRLMIVGSLRRAVNKKWRSKMYKEASRIKDVVKEFGVALKNNKALCPFHEEKDDQGGRNGLSR